MTNCHWWPSAELSWPTWCDSAVFCYEQFFMTSVPKNELQSKDNSEIVFKHPNLDRIFRRLVCLQELTWFYMILNPITFEPLIWLWFLLQMSPLEPIITLHRHNFAWECVKHNYVDNMWRSFKIMSVLYMSWRSVVIKQWFVHKMCGGEQTQVQCVYI